MKPIGMREMALVFDVTDELDLSREQIVVPLLPAGSGSIERMADGRFRIEIPATDDLEQWLPELRLGLEALLAEDGAER